MKTFTTVVGIGIALYIVWKFSSANPTANNAGGFTQVSGATQNMTTACGQPAVIGNESFGYPASLPYGYSCRTGSLGPISLIGVPAPSNSTITEAAFHATRQMCQYYPAVSPVSMFRNRQVGGIAV
jgi:hypothetical protein